MQLASPAHLVCAILTFGMGLIIVWADRRDSRNRAMAVCLFAIALSLVVNEDNSARWVAMLWNSFLVIAVLAGIEWGRRIGESASGRRRAAANGLFRAAQIVMLAMWIVMIVFIATGLDPGPNDGFIRRRGIEFALFAPFFGTMVLLGAIAIILLLTVDMDYAETQRLRMLSRATPFLLGGLIVADRYVPYTIAIGLLWLLFGSVRYLQIQGQRGQFMAQFLSPEVTRLVRQRGMEQALKRQRRVISVVVCDLRGFTNYARQHDSEQVVELLEHFYRAVGEAARLHHGTIKDHAGDGVLILIGAPLEVTDHEQQAALLAFELMKRGQQMLHGAGLQGEVGLGVGIATGNTTVGAIHGAGQLEYVAVGNAVNLASRLCDRAADGEILADTRSYEALAPVLGITADEREPEPLKGFPEPIPICALHRDWTKP